MGHRSNGGVGMRFDKLELNRRGRSFPKILKQRSSVNSIYPTNAMIMISRQFFNDAEEKMEM